MTSLKTQSFVRFFRLAFVMPLLFVMWFQSCSVARFHELSQLEKPQLTYKDYVFEGMGNGEVHMVVNFDVLNPNDVPINDLTIHYVLSILDDETVLEGDFLDIDLPANQSTSMSMPVTVEMDGLLKAGTYAYLQMLAGKKDIAGKLYVEMQNTKPVLGFKPWDGTIGETYDVALPLPEAGMDLLGDLLKNMSN